MSFACNLLFASREFVITEGQARFEPSRGIWPTFSVLAQTQYEKSQVLSGTAAQSVSFVEPRSSSQFTVFLDIVGEFSSVFGGDNGGFRLNLDPTLSSDARIQETSSETQSLSSGPRALSQEEILGLLTFDRLEVEPDLLGQVGSVFGAAAQNALDATIDTLILAELQTTLRDALGVDIFEIRTTPISSLLSGDSDQPFGVSLRLGGYIDDNGFASYQIGSFNDADQQYALTNEVRFQLDLEPLEISVLGRVDFLTESFVPESELTFRVGYAFSERLSLDTSLLLATERQGLSFGVSVKF